MNWTEGKLARFSRRKGWNQEASKQRNHFAKARSRQQRQATVKTSTHLSGFVPDYIPKPQPTSALACSEHQICPKPKSEQSRQPKQPTRRHLSSVINHPATTGMSNIAMTPPRPFNEAYHSQETRPVDDLDAKRRKLLEQEDWTGIEFQRPIRVEYTSHYEPPADHSYNGALHYYGNQSHSHRSCYRRDSRVENPIRVHIGDKALGWNHQNNTTTSIGSTAGSLTTIEDWESQNDTSTPIEAGNSSREMNHLALLSHSHDNSINTNLAEERPKCIVRASPELQHPKPHTMKVRKALGRWMPSENEEGSDGLGSTATQASQHSPTSRQDKVENEKWHRWLEYY